MGDFQNHGFNRIRLVIHDLDDLGVVSILGCPGPCGPPSAWRSWKSYFKASKFPTARCFPRIVTGRPPRPWSRTLRWSSWCLRRIIYKALLQKGMWTCIAPGSSPLIWCFSLNRSFRSALHMFCFCDLTWSIAFPCRLFPLVRMRWCVSTTCLQRCIGGSQVGTLPISPALERWLGLASS